MVDGCFDQRFLHKLLAKLELFMAPVNSVVLR
jgi:hypothetical protein